MSGAMIDSASEALEECIAMPAMVFELCKIGGKRVIPVPGCQYPRPTVGYRHWPLLSVRSQDFASPRNRDHRKCTTMVDTLNHLDFEDAASIKWSIHFLGTGPHGHMDTRMTIAVSCSSCHVYIHRLHHQDLVLRFTLDH